MKKTRVACLVLLLAVAAACVGAASAFDSGAALYAQDKPKEARPLLEQAVAEEPANEKAWLWLGIVYQQLGETQKALDALARGREIATTLRDLMSYNLGNVSYVRKDYAAAAEAYTVALAANSSLAPAYLNRANARLAMKTYDGALADYVQYLQLRPQDAQKASIEKVIALLRAALDEQEKARQAEIARQQAEAARQQALLDDVLNSLNNAGDDAQNVTVESLKGQTDPVDVDIKD